MEHKRIDCSRQTPEEIAAAVELEQTIFKFNHTMPATEENRKLMHRVFPHLGENSVVRAPFTV